MNEQHLLKDEFIGRNVTIRDCSDPVWRDVSGVVLDETKQMFLIQVGSKQKRIAKNIATFEFVERGETIRVEGERLCFRPEDRIKKTR